MAKDAAAVAAAPVAFQYIAALPFILLVVFGIIWVVLRARGGYSAVQAREADALQLGQSDPADFNMDAVRETDIAAARKR
jgi:flagellar biogenesis protein FliO